MRIDYRDRHVEQLHQDIAALLLDSAGGVAVVESIRERLVELALANCPAAADYWRRTRAGLGVPDSAFRGASPYFFPEVAPARTFRTSGTSGAGRGSASYSPRGLALMDRSILANARRHIVPRQDRPMIVRLVPSEQLAPEMVMAHGMELIARELGHPELSTCVVTANGLDLSLLSARLNLACSEGLPLVLIGGSFGFVNLGDALEAQGRAWSLPTGSRMVDAGGFKGRSRVVGVDGLRAVAWRAFGIPAAACTNLFGMTELASQLYDCADVPLGPLGERPKGRMAFVEPRVRDPQDLSLRAVGEGLLEVEDLCILDRPHVVLTGDRGIASAGGVAVAGRIERGQSRGCSLTLDAMTGGAA